MLARAVRQHASDEPRHALLPAPVEQRALVTLVAEEELVSSVARDRDGDVFLRLLAEQQVGEKGGIRERLIQDLREIVQNRLEIAGPAMISV